MTNAVPPIPPVTAATDLNPPAAAAPPSEGGNPASRADRVELHRDDATFAAGRVAADLHEHGRELRFGADPSTGRIVVEVRDLDGNVLRTIPPAALRHAHPDLQI
jgi:flagellar protein FlaG